ncbi:MAG: hypothetical protein MRERC_2c107 [Mycoplasmataceae bacterium RC_NB112A]|nr:MAG: hypothetical protein MRERC_2c107 [Mycoplasmataceae bacterium RC_NB112A]
MNPKVPMHRNIPPFYKKKGSEEEFLINSWHRNW